MPRCPSCGKDVPVLCAEDGLCRDCSDCCGGEGATLDLGDRSPTDA